MEKIGLKNIQEIEIDFSIKNKGVCPEGDYVLKI